MLGLSSHLGFKEAMVSGHGPIPSSDTAGHHVYLWGRRQDKWNAQCGLRGLAWGIQESAT